MYHAQSDDEGGPTDMERRLIRVDFSPSQEGIAAALRRAFVSIQMPAEQDEFEELLARIH